MKLSKKQIRAIVKLLKKQTFKPALSNMVIQCISGTTRLLVTDGYVVASWPLEGCDYLRGRVIPVEALEGWISSNSAHSVFDEVDVKYYAVDDTVDYPDMQRHLDRIKQNEAVDSISFDADRYKTIQDVAGGICRLWFNGIVGPIGLTKDDGFVGAVCPIRFY